MAVVEGRVSDDPDERANALRIVVAAERVNGEEAQGRVLAVLPRDTEVFYGDKVTVRGVLEAPQSFETDTGRIFDYPGYLRARGIELLMPHAALQSSAPGSWSIIGTLFAAKHAFERALERVIREPYAALMEGLLLGEKRGLPEALTQAFVLAGLIHIVVLSGYNIGVVADWSLRFLGIFLPKKAALASVGVIIVLFALMAGGGMATVRACLMGLIAVLARYLDRPALALRSLGIAALGMAAWNPLVVFDAGFILSVLATFGLITLSPSVERVLSRFWREGVLRATAATTIAVQIFVLPALLYFTGILSLVAFPVNVLVLPFVPLSMLLGFLAGILALVHPYLALLPALAGEWLLRGIIWVSQFAAGLPLAAFTVPAFPAWVAVLVYAPLTWLAISKHRRTAPRQPTN